jgi:hypothetical protein
MTPSIASHFLTRLALSYAQHLMILLAASFNTGGWFATLSFPSLYRTLVFDSPALNLILQLVLLVPALLLIALTRGRLGYHHYQQDAEALDLPSSVQDRSRGRY